MHAALTAHGAAREVAPGEPKQQHGRRCGCHVRGRWLAQQVPTLTPPVTPRPIGEQAKVPNAHEAAWDQVQEEATEGRNSSVSRVITFTRSWSA